MTNEQALEQEPCELLIIKSNILLHQEDRKKWMESIKREKENGVIILPPYFEPLLVPNDIEISIEQEPKTGHWEWVQYDYNPKIGNWHCSECRCIVVECVDKEEKGGIPLYKYCPQCGAKMESEEQTE